MRKIVSVLMLAALAAAVSVQSSSARVAPPGSALLEALPDGNAVAVIDFQKLSGSALWAAITGQDKLKSSIDKAQSEMADLGLKLSDVHTVALVFPAAGRNNPTVALTGGFEQNDLLARLRANAKVKLTSEKYKTFEIYSVRSIPAPVPPSEASGTKPANASAASARNDETSFVFYDASTVVASSLEGVRASVDVKTGARSGISQNVRLTEALWQNPAAAVRFALAITPAMASGFKSSDFPIPDLSSVTLVFGSIDVASGIEVVATLRSDNADHAKAISERLNGLVAMARGFLGGMSDPKMASIAEALKTVNITSADADVRITGSLPLELLNSLLSLSAKKG